MQASMISALSVQGLKIEGFRLNVSSLLGFFHPPVWAYTEYILEYKYAYLELYLTP